VAMTPLRRELGEEGPRDYERVARQRLTDFAVTQGMPYLDFLPLFQATDYERLYFDHIHLSAQGNDWVGQALATWITEQDQPPHQTSQPGEEPMTDLW
jgi:lysophospholipase L1-like esterase